ncbi:MAG: serine--tRNA ligase, partial [Pseudomonadota bacterium]
DVPAGQEESDNKIIGKNGQIGEFDFEVKQHFELGQQLGMMDFETAAQMSGSRFVVLKDDLARLEQALVNFMLDQHRELGFQQLSLPHIVREQAMYGAGQLPKFSDDSYVTTDNMRLIPTTEVPLVNTVANKIIDQDYLPYRLTAFSPCFRRESGSAGRDTRGMLRQHQFGKVELVTICTAEQEHNEYEYMLSAAKNILIKLKLPFQEVLLCTGDIGFSAYKTIDLEVWLPGQGCYREISSVSTCHDFQGRRLKSRYRTSTGNKYVCTLNGSGLAVGRTLVAVLENYQQADGSIMIPKVLQAYMSGKTYIKPIDNVVIKA